MYLVILIIIVIACILLGLIVLIQNPKGGGLSANFSGSSQLMGVQKTGDFLEKGTWVLAITIMVLSLVMNATLKGGAQKAEDPQLMEQIKKASKPTAAPASAPISIPAAPVQNTPKK